MWRVSRLIFDSATFAVESAVQGEGVVLGRSMLVQPTSPPAGWFNRAGLRLFENRGGNISACAAFAGS